jgi:hypothetical protein
VNPAALALNIAVIAYDIFGYELMIDLPADF